YGDITFQRNKQHNKMEILPLWDIFMMNDDMWWASDPQDTGAQLIINLSELIYILTIYKVFISKNFFPITKESPHSLVFAIHTSPILFALAHSELSSLACGS
ncbi:hypothetical protein ACJX0J_022603, partial [Zea mays]